MLGKSAKDHPIGDATNSFEQMGVNGIQNAKDLGRTFDVKWQVYMGEGVIAGEGVVCKAHRAMS